MALWLTQPLTEMCTRNVLQVKARPARKANNLISNCEKNVGSSTYHLMGLHDLLQEEVSHTLHNNTMIKHSSLCPYVVAVLSSLLFSVCLFAYHKLISLKWSKKKYWDHLRWSCQLKWGKLTQSVEVDKGADFRKSSEPCSILLAILNTGLYTELRTFVIMHVLRCWLRHVLLSELEDWDTMSVMSGRSTLFFIISWCLVVNVFLTCDASRSLWHHPVTTDVPSVEDFNKNEKLPAVYSLEDPSSL
jgi:hypothetical protein